MGSMVADLASESRMAAVGRAGAHLRSAARTSQSVFRFNAPAQRTGAPRGLLHPRPERYRRQHPKRYKHAEYGELGYDKGCFRLCRREALQRTDFLKCLRNADKNIEIQGRRR